MFQKWWIAKKPMWNTRNWSIPKNGELWNGELWSGELRGPPVFTFKCFFVSVNIFMFFQIIWTDELFATIFTFKVLWGVMRSEPRCKSWINIYINISITNVSCLTELYVFAHFYSLNSPRWRVCPTAAGFKKKRKVYRWPSRSQLLQSVSITCGFFVIAL